MENLEFDDEATQVLEAFNASPGARMRRVQILQALDLAAGHSVLDVGSGPGHQAAEISPLIGPQGLVEGIDIEDSANSTARARCAGLANVHFRVGDTYALPFDDAGFDRVLSSQVFEYLPDIPGALAEIFRVLKPRGRVLIHDTDWGTLIWPSSDQKNAGHILDVWDGHLADPYLPRTLGSRLSEAGFTDIKATPIVQVETVFDAQSLSAAMINFVAGYVVSQGVAPAQVDVWAADLRGRQAPGSYFFSLNEYIFTATKA